MVYAACFFFAALAAWGEPPADTNQVPNGSFEAGDLLPAGWSFSKKDGAEGACVVDGAIRRTGGRSVRIQKTNGRGFFTFDLNRGLPIVPGKSYELRGYVHIPEAQYESKTYFVIRQYPADSNKYLPPNLFSSFDQRVAIRTRPGEWSVRSTLFTARPGAGRVEITLVVTGNPCTVYWDDLYLGPPLKTRLDLPRLEPEKLHSVEEVYQRLAERPNATAEVKPYRGRPALFINGEPTPPLLHLMCFWRPFTSYNGDFGRAGLHVHVCPIILAPYLRDGFRLWKGKGKYDFSRADEVLLFALRADPDAFLVPDLCLIGAYSGWGNEHPGEVCQDFNGLGAIGKSVHNTRYGTKLEDPLEFWCPSYYSGVYRRDGQKVIRAFIDHLKTTPFFKAVVGFSITGGDDGQFSLWRRSGPSHVPDYSPAARRGFSRFLEQRYGSEAGLQKAWHDPQASLKTIQLPSPPERNGKGAFRDPLKDARLADYHRMLSEGTAELIRGFAGAAKAAAGKPVFCTTYWGAHTMGGGNSNHYGVRRLLQTTEIDIFHAPAGYGPWRRLGWTGACHGALESLTLHNKLFLQELDLRTFTRGYKNEAWRTFIAWAANLDEFRAIHRRETGMMLAHRVGAWYYDMSGGWFHDPGIMEDIRQVQQAARADLSSRSPWRPDVAIVVDEESSHWIGESAFNIFFSSLNPVRASLALSGVPYDLLLLDDVLLPQAPDYKVFVFLNCFRMTDVQVSKVEDRFKRGGKVLVWLYAPGYVSDRGLSVEQVSRLVGMRLRYSPDRVPLACVSGPGNHPLAQNLLPLQGNSTTAGRFWVEDEKAVALGRYASDGKVAIAGRDFGSWRSVYIAPPGCLEPTLLNNIARWASAYVCADPGESVAANERFISVHGVRGGQHRFYLPQRATVRDLLTGKVLARDTKTFEAAVPLQETRWFGME